MANVSLHIDDYLAEVSPVLGRMRLDGLTETAVPFAERAVALWRRGAPTPDMDGKLLIDVLKVRPVPSSPPRHCETLSCLLTSAAGRAQMHHEARVTECWRSSGGALP